MILVFRSYHAQLLPLVKKQMNTKIFKKSYEKNNNPNLTV